METTFLQCSVSEKTGTRGNKCEKKVEEERNMDRSETKQTLRRNILSARASLSAAEREQRSSAASRHLLALEPLAACRTILLFYPYKDEIDTRPFMAAAIRRGQEIWLPLTDPAERRLTPYVYGGEKALRQGAYGIWEPDPTVCRQADIAKLDAVVLPGVAFDGCGGRLGYGGGYYDRFLERCGQRPLLVGYAFATQVVERVPTEPHDVPIDYLVTDDGINGPFQRYVL
jgi:5-formyltetrahydrofolate cyclo-ligase